MGKLFMFLFALSVMACGPTYESITDAEFVTANREHFRIDIKDHSPAILADAWQSCELEGKRLPTSNEWHWVIAGNFAGIEKPTLDEWYIDTDANGVYSVMNAGFEYSNEAIAKQNAFRCAFVTEEPH